MDTKQFWNFEGDPYAQGWYPVLVCYDTSEGFFPRSAYWDGKAWGQKAIAAFGGKCDTADEAEQLAWKHDIE